MIDRGSHVRPNTWATTESAASPHRDVRGVFEALVMASAFEPLAGALGFYGDVVVANVTAAVFARESDVRSPVARPSTSLGDRS